MQWYTYCWYDADWIPYYVGKGCGTRSRVRRGIPHPEEGHVVLKHFELEEQAFEHEKQLIAFWGRREFDDNGLLMNISTGGPGAPGVPASEKKIKASKKLGQKLGKKWGPINGAAMGRKSAEEKAISAVVTDPDGVEQTVKNLTRFCRKHGFDRGNVWACLSGRQKTMKGWKFRYA